MENNILNKLTVHILNTGKTPAPEKLLENGLITTDLIYSYLVYAEYDGDKLTGWSVEFLVSQTINYNTITISEAVGDVTRIITDAWNKSQVKYVIGYKQPPIEVMIETFDPLVKKLAAKQREYWSLMEFEDLCQICRLVICHLYKEGYYLHSKLISKAFTNEVLMQLRPERYRPEIASLDKVIDIGNGDEITLIDKVMDKGEEERKEDAELLEVTLRILQEKRNIVIEALGGSERQYQQLVREYGNRQASPWARMTVQRIKKYLEKIDIDDKSFDYLK